MRRPTRIAIPLVILALVTAVAAAFAAVVPIYSNDMATAGARSQLARLGSGKCDRGGGGQALKVTLGKGTRECSLRTPVIGANLDVKATARLSQATPAILQKKVFVAVGVRDSGDGAYQLAVFPGKGSYQLRRDLPPDGTRTVLAKGSASVVKSVGKPNKLRLQAFPTADGGLQLTAFVNGRKLASVVEDAHTAATVSGRFSSLSVGALKAARGASASFDDLTVAVPDPF